MTQHSRLTTLKFFYNSHAFASLTEVIVASVIFAIAAAGILSTVSFLKPQSTVSARRLEAAYLGKNILEQMRAQVGLNDWDGAGGDLTPGLHGPEFFDCGSGNCEVTWFVSQAIPDPNDASKDLLRKVVMNIEYPE